MLLLLLLFILFLCYYYYYLYLILEGYNPNIKPFDDSFSNRHPVAT